MKKFLALLVVTLFMVGCGSNEPSQTQRNQAATYVEGSNGHYSCVINQNLYPEPNKVWVGDFKSATAAETYCSKIGALLSQEALQAAGSTITSYR